MDLVEAVAALEALPNDVQVTISRTVRAGEEHGRNIYGEKSDRRARWVVDLVWPSDGDYINTYTTINAIYGVSIVDEPGYPDGSIKCWRIHYDEDELPDLVQIILNLYKKVIGMEIDFATE